MAQKKEEKETTKKKTGLFDYILESSIKSSKTVVGIVNELITIAEEVNSLRINLLNLSKIIQIHQVAIEDICKLLEQHTVSKKGDLIFPSIDSLNKKDDKPN